MPKLTQDHQSKKVAEFDTLPDSALVSIRTVAGVTGVHINTAWRRIQQDPRYPKPIRLSARCTRFKVGDVRSYIKGASA